MKIRIYVPLNWYRYGEMLSYIKEKVELKLILFSLERCLNMKISQR